MLRRFRIGFRSLKIPLTYWYHFSEILKSSKPISCWNHIGKNENSYDLIISRGINSSNLKPCTFWWQGPKFFYQPVEHWCTPVTFSNVNIPEFKQSKQISLISTSNFRFPFERFSKSIVWTMYMLYAFDIFTIHWLV